MNQTRNFLLFALLAVAYLLFMAWENDHAPKPAPTPAATASQAVPTSADGSVRVERRAFEHGGNRRYP